MREEALFQALFQGESVVIKQSYRFLHTGKTKSWGNLRGK